MDKMKAYVRVSDQSEEVERIEVPIPIIEKNEVLINVKAFGVGIHDRYFIPSNVKFPFVIGAEGSGVIVKIGSEVFDFQKGDRVIFSSSMLAKGGSWAKYVAVPANCLIHMPDTLDFEVGAALPVAGKTAMESIRALNLHKGDTLFVAGATGAIGSLVVQLATNLGIDVIGSASSKNQKYMQAIGAKKSVDYTNLNWKQEVKNWKPGGVEAALAIQKGTGKDSMDVVKKGGTLITVSGDKVHSDRGIFVKQFQHQLNIQEAIEKLVEEIDTGKVEVVISHVYPFEKALDALEKSETRHVRGKLIVSIK